MESEFREDLRLTGVKKLGLMGGTFDPIHHGHLVAAEAARSEFGLDKVVFVPSGQPPHKSGHGVTSKENRYLMTELATLSNPRFEVSKVEVERQGYSYAIDTVRYFKNLLPADGELYFITGADAVSDIVSWHAARELFHYCTFIAATRPGFRQEAIRERLEAAMSPEELAKIAAVEVPAMAISSTDIRERLAAGRTIKYLVPEVVEDFIRKNDLYQPSGGKPEGDRH